MHSGALIGRIQYHRYKNKLESEGKKEKDILHKWEWFYQIKNKDTTLIRYSPHFHIIGPQYLKQRSEKDPWRSEDKEKILPTNIE